MSQPVDLKNVERKTIYPSSDCFHGRIPGDTVCLLCGKPWAEIERENAARRTLKDQSKKRDNNGK